MPRIGMTVNQWYTEISSSDPETIGRWFSEQLLRFPEIALGSTNLRLRIDPLWSPATPQHPEGIPDWHTDSRWTHSGRIQCGRTTQDSIQAILAAMTAIAYPQGEDTR
jgi:hypothetical protein